MTIHDDALAAFTGVYDTVISSYDAKISELEALNKSLGESLDLSVADVAEYQLRTLELTESVNSLTDIIVKLQERIKELESNNENIPDGWEVLYESSFQDDDGWEKRQETQSNDNSYNTPKNVSFGDRGMVLISKRESLGGRPYTSADVLGKHIRVPNYFRADVKATLPTEYGQWPCPLWFRPLTGGDSGEIDVCETWPFDWNGKPRSYSTIWENYTTKRKANNGASGFPYANLDNSDPASVHTYSVVKTPGKIEFLLDDVRVFCWQEGATYSASERIAPLPSWYNSVYEISGREWYPRVTIQTGGPNAGEPEASWNQSELIVHSLRILKMS